LKQWHTDTNMRKEECFMKEQSKARKKMSVERKSVIFLAVVLVLTLFIGVISVTGLPLDSRSLYKIKSWVPSLNVSNWPSSIPLGIDIGGGTYTEYQAALPEGSNQTLDAALNDTVSILRVRLKERGYLEGSISPAADGKIRINLPKAKEKDELLSLLSAGGKLTFSYPDGAFLEGNHIKNAIKEKDPSTALPIVRMLLDAEGTKTLSDATTAHSGQVLTVTLDGQTLVSTTLEAPIFNGEITISGFVSEQAASDTSNILRSGMLPAELTKAGTGDVAPALGGILQLLVIIGLILVAAAIAYMVFRFLLGGVAASWALLTDIILIFFLMAVFPVTQLTLLGIIGLVLGIALFVWTSVFFLDKFAQGLKPGRLHKSSVFEGFKDIQGTVWKVHGICIAASLLLLILPIGFLRSFAVAVLASSVSSLIVTMVITWLLLYHVARVVKKDPERFARIKKA
jgi:preprotein translocase subunit SecD